MDDDQHELEAFAARYRLHVRRDECGDPIIPGRRGQSHLYIAAGELCLMVLDGPVAQRSAWKAVGGKLWLGDISPHSKTGRRVQDVWIKNIPPEHAKLAIRMARVKTKRVMSEAQRQTSIRILAKARDARRLKSS